MAAATLVIGSYISPHVRKVLVCLDIKGIGYRIDPIVPFFGLGMAGAPIAAQTFGAPTPRPGILSI